MSTFPPNEPGPPPASVTTGTFVAPNAPAAGETSPDERTYAMLMHLSLLAHMFAGGFAIVIPIIMWLVKRDDSHFIDDHGKEVTNFQISLIIYSLVTLVIAIITCGVGAVLMLIVYVLGIVGMILAAIATNRGEFYRYPMTIRLIH